jgi:hypothetical protein
MFAALPALTAAVGHSISIAERAALEVPSNQGMKLTPDRRG